MPPEAQRLKRLQRLERVRAIARQAAAREAAEAESSRAQLAALADRTGRLAADYAARRGAADGAALRQLGQFAEGLARIHTATTLEAERARGHADGKLAALGEAERRRAAVEERAQATARDLTRGRQVPVLVGRRPSGTGLE